MKAEYLIVITPLVWLAVADGVLPIWIGIMATLTTTIITGGQVIRLMRGGGFDDDPSPSVANIMTEWTTRLYQRESSAQPVKQNWNCKNCGGPNVNQVQCEYCGMVKE